MFAWYHSNGMTLPTTATEAWFIIAMTAMSLSFIAFLVFIGYLSDRE